MRSDRNVLLIGPPDWRRDIDRHILALDFVAFGADDVNDAVQRLRSLRARPRAVLFDPSAIDGDLAHLRSVCPSRAIAVGWRPDDAERARLREAGVQLAAWEPCRVEDLRFLLGSGRFLDGGRTEARRSLRVPVWLGARLSLDTEVHAVVTDLSTGGASMRTAAPIAQGETLELALDLPDGPAALRSRLVGRWMGEAGRSGTMVRVAFEGVPPLTLERLERFVIEQIDRYRV